MKALGRILLRRAERGSPTLSILVVRKSAIGREVVRRRRDGDLTEALELLKVLMNVGIISVGEVRLEVEKNASGESLHFVGREELSRISSHARW